jgi:hypothetical protein
MASRQGENSRLLGSLVGAAAQSTKDDIPLISGEVRDAVERVLTGFRAAKAVRRQQFVEPLTQPGVNP